MSRALCFSNHSCPRSLSPLLEEEVHLSEGHQRPEGSAPNCPPHVVGAAPREARQGPVPRGRNCHELSPLPAVGGSPVGICPRQVSLLPSRPLHIHVVPPSPPSYIRDKVADTVPLATPATVPTRSMASSQSVQSYPPIKDETNDKSETETACGSL